MNEIPYHFNAIVDGGIIVSLCPKCGAMYEITRERQTSEEAKQHYKEAHMGQKEKS